MQVAIYKTLLQRLEAQLAVLADKPEETPVATLRALWLAACEVPASAERALVHELPPLHETHIDRLDKMLNDRLAGVPLAHITGRQQFMGIELVVGPQALLPRKETEILGMAVLELVQAAARVGAEPIVFDICTGSGNLACAYALHEPTARLYAADLSPEAVQLAQVNVAHHGLESRVQLGVGDLMAPFDRADLHRAVDVLSCNPPYISSTKVDEMPSEIGQHEPRLAFDGGVYGISIVQRVIREAPKYVKPHGWVGFEVGLGQGDALVKRLKNNKHYAEIDVARDVAGEIRVILAQVR